MQVQIVDDRCSHAAQLETLKVSDRAARVYAAVAASPNQVFRFGYGKLAFVTHLPETQVVKGVEELRERFLVSVFQPEAQERKALVIRRDSWGPALDLGPITLREIHHYAQVDFDCLPAVSTPCMLEVDSDINFSPAKENYIQHQSATFDIPRAGLKEVVESSLEHYLNYLLYGLSAFNCTIHERKRACTNWTATSDLYLGDLDLTDSVSCTDVSLAGYWAWRVGIERVAHGQPLSIPDVAGTAGQISRLMSRYGAEIAINMLDHAACKWRILAHLPQFQSLCLGRLPAQNCWMNEKFVYEVHRRVALNHQG